MGALGREELDAATKAAGHAATPATTYLDPLSQIFVTVTDNGPDGQGVSQKIPTRTRLDIRGKLLEIRDAIVEAGDAQGRIVAQYEYDVPGTRIHQRSMDAGERWILTDALGKPLRVWDARGHVLATVYDALRRPVSQTVQGFDPAQSDPRTLSGPVQTLRTEYGEHQSAAEKLNLRTRIYRQFDSAGVITHGGVNPNTGKHEAFDFKGNLLRSTRRLVKDYKAIANWSGRPALTEETFTSATRYDALNRVIFSILPYSDQPEGLLNVIQANFNQASLPERIDVWIGLATEPVTCLDPAVVTPSPVGVANFDYDAKGQRTRVDSMTRRLSG
jgi:YD repeat-containing protein